MPRKAKLLRISSFSSEDPNHPVTNLLTPETFRKWKCKEPGEKEAFVILQLDKVEKITSIDIGNENSAFIEVSVGRSGGVNQEFEVIQNQTAFMTASESKTETNGHRVKMFSTSLVKSVALERWDLVKVTCVQPFNPRIQYGISFITIIVEPDPSEVERIGGFRIRKPVSDVLEIDDPIRIGSYFAKKMAAAGISLDKDLKTTSITTTSTSSSAAAAMRGISVSLAGPAVNENKRKTANTVTSNLSSGSGEVSSMKGHEPDNGNQSQNITKAAALISTSLSAPKNSKRNQKVVNGGNPSGSHYPQSIPGLPASKGFQVGTKSLSDDLTRAKSKTSLMRKNSKCSRKPFSKLFENVVFVMSGFENPYRSQLRNKATEMGAQCKHDWNPSCTHLICAFVNTPKFRQVKAVGNGKIVTKKWIEDSYAKKCRFPWRRYCLDKDDKGDESEEEVLALEDSGDQSNPDDDDLLDSQEIGAVVSQRHDYRNLEGREGEDEEEDIVLAPYSPKSSLNDDSAKRRKIGRLSSSSSDDPAYDADTDIDEPLASLTASDRNDSPQLDSESNHHHNKYNNDFFNSKLFFLHPSQPLDKDKRNEIEQIIQRHSGSLVSCLSTHVKVDFVVTSEVKWIEEFSQMIHTHPELLFISDQWIHECDEANKIISMEPFLILRESED